MFEPEPFAKSILITTQGKLTKSLGHLAVSFSHVCAGWKTPKQALD